MKIFNFWQNFNSTSNFHKYFKWTKDQFRIQFWYLQLTHKSEMTMFKKWSKSEISLRSAVMKIINFWQNFDSTSNFHKSFKSTKEHFRIQYRYLQFTHKSEMTMIKMWSKSEISLRTAVMKIFNFLQNFDSTSNFQKWLKKTKKHFCQKLKIFITGVLTEISDFDHFLNIVISDLWVNCKYQYCILKCSLVDLKDLWKFEVESKFCQKLKIFMTAVLSEISDFDHFLNIVISDLWVNCKCQNDILKCPFVVLNHLWKFEVESKFCQKLKIFMTAVLSEISDFDHFLNIVISDLWVNCNYQNDILKCFFVDLNYLLKFEVESKFCEKLKIFMTAVLSEI